jgi:hypothetical protein
VKERRKGGNTGESENIFFSLAEKLSGRETRETSQKKRKSTSGEVSTQGFFGEVLASKLREVLPPKTQQKPDCLNSPNYCPDS